MVAGICAAQPHHLKGRVTFHFHDDFLAPCLALVMLKSKTTFLIFLKFLKVVK